MVDTVQVYQLECFLKEGGDPLKNSIRKLAESSQGFRGHQFHRESFRCDMNCYNLILKVQSNWPAVPTAVVKQKY